MTKDFFQHETVPQHQKTCLRFYIEYEKYFKIVFCFGIRASDLYHIRAENHIYSHLFIHEPSLTPTGQTAYGAHLL